jgi:hypothetical protein
MLAIKGVRQYVPTRRKYAWKYENIVEHYVVLGRHVPDIPAMTITMTNQLMKHLLQEEWMFAIQAYHCYLMSIEDDDVTSGVHDGARINASIIILGSYGGDLTR